MNPQVRQERSGWRDQRLSERHRQWGWNCPAVDLDFVMAEYNHGKPVALVEYKLKGAKLGNMSHPTYLTLIELADGYKNVGIPCLIAVYDPTNWTFVITPLNALAKEYYANYAGHEISEQRFVRSIYLLRKKVLDAEDEKAIAKLNSIESFIQF